MANEHLPVNGTTFAPSQTQAYAIEQASVTHSATDSVDGSGSASAEIPKDEVGWYFVEQYYTTLSKSPEKLYLFYNKHSQFVSGSETDKVNVCVGQKAIDERIKALDIQDCKVRVTNVDSQGSGHNIVIQVIGEMSNKTTPRTKFTQTFVLAEQTNGYFVLNDIFRYIVDDDDEPEAEDNADTSADMATEAAAEEPQVLTNSADPKEREHNAQLVDQGLKEAIADGKEPPSVIVNGNEPVDTATASDEGPIVAPGVEDGDTGTVSVEPTVTSAVDEKPPAPQSTPAPVASPKSATATQASAPPKPSGPKTWANLVAANKPAVVMPQSATSGPQAAPAAQAAQPKAPATAAAQPATAAQAPTAPAASTEDAEQPATPASSGSEWQTAQQHHGKKQQRTQSNAAPVANSRAYMKNISENINEDQLRAALTKYGELSYLDINRSKNCAFADFATVAAYQAAVAANPHDVNGERVFVEQRHVRPQSFGGSFPGGRGGMPLRGRGGKEGGQRGGFPGRGRAAGPRGRGVSSAA